MMKTQDFSYMWRGRTIAPLAPQDAYRLAPINIRRDERRRALLLLHGFSSSPAVFRNIIPFLPPYDAIVCPTLPGHAKTLEEFTHVSASDWINTVEKTCRELHQEYDKVDVVGFSLGGLLACELSQRVPLHHLYLLAPALALHAHLPSLLFCAQGLLKIGIKSIRNRAGQLYSSQYTELAFRRLPVHAIIEILTHIRDHVFVQPCCPVDLFLGTHDRVVNSNAVMQLFQDTPHAHIHQLQESAHVLPLDTDAQAILQVIAANWMKDESQDFPNSKILF